MSKATCVICGNEFEKGGPGTTCKSSKCVLSNRSRVTCKYNKQHPEGHRRRARKRMRRLRADPVRGPAIKVADIARIKAWEKKYPLFDYASRRASHLKQSKIQKRNLSTLPHTLNRKDWNLALEHFSRQCVYCGEQSSSLHQEHFIPVVSGGGYTRDNIIPACRVCNLDKSTIDPVVWLSSKPDGFARLCSVWDYFRQCGRST